jgi:hypothetical protein
MIAEEMRGGEHVVAAEPFPAEELEGGMGPGDGEVPVEAAAG